MSVVCPPIYTPMHDEEAAALASANEESMRKIARNLNWLANQLPLGAIVPIQTNQSGVGLINGDIYQLCDNSEITNPKSPLRSRGLDIKRTPLLTDIWPRAASANTGNPSGGSNSFDIQHKHGGATGVNSPLTPIVGEEGNERHSFVNHAHGIQDDLANGTVIDHPPYIFLAAFMKIS